MISLQNLREERSRAAAAITGLADRLVKEKRDFDAAERQQWDKANGDYDRLGREIAAAERAEQVRKDQERGAGDRDAGREDYDPRKKKGRRDRVQPTEEQRSLVLNAWARSQYGISLSRRQREACRNLRFNPAQRQLKIRLWGDEQRNDVKGRFVQTAGEARRDLVRRESRANLSAQVPTSGGYLVAPGSMASSFEMNLLAFGGVRQVAEEFTTQSGEPFLWPTVDDTSNSGEQLGENTSIGSGTNPSFSQKLWQAYKFSSKPVLVPTELMEDDQYDISARLGEMLGIRLGRITATKYATGSGASTPEGIVTGASAGITAASATAITFDELVRLEHTIDPAYRSQPGAGWLMHDLIVSYIRRIKDGAGRPLWVAGEHYNSGIKEGRPDSLLGYPINICQEMASSVATTNVTVLFGLLSKYKIRKVRGVRLYRLVERYRDLDQDGFVAFIREDGKLLDAGTAPVKKLTQA